MNLSTIIYLNRKNNHDLWCYARHRAIHKMKRQIRSPQKHKYYLELRVTTQQVNKRVERIIQCLFIVKICHLTVIPSCCLFIIPNCLPQNLLLNILTNWIKSGRLGECLKFVGLQTAVGWLHLAKTPGCVSL